MKCSEPDCIRAGTRTGLCPKHYMRKYRSSATASLPLGVATEATSPTNGHSAQADPVRLHAEAVRAHADVIDPTPTTVTAWTPPIPAPVTPVGSPNVDDAALDAAISFVEALKALKGAQVPAPAQGISDDTAAALESLDSRVTDHTARLNQTEEAVTQTIDMVESATARITALEARAPSVLEIRIPDRPAVTIDGHRHRIFEEVLQVAVTGYPVMLVGPSGSGKTTLARQIAEALGRPFYFTGAILTKFELLGYQDATGQYRPSLFRRAYAGHGDDAPGVFLWDEIDCSDPQALKAFNAGLENGHADFPDGMITRSPDFWTIAAANTYGRGADRQYVGANQLDASSLERFVVIDMDYDEELERATAGDTPWTRQVQAWRTACNTLKIRHVISPRASLRGNVLISAGIPESKVADMVVWKGLDPAQVEKIKTAGRI